MGILLLWLQWLLPGAIYAADITLDLTVTSIDQHVEATVSNRSGQIVQLRDFQIELNNQRYSIFSSTQLQPEEKHSYQLNVALPALPGSYLIVSRLTYQNENHWLTLQNAGIFYVDQRRELPANCHLQQSTLKKNQSTLTLLADNQFNWRLLLPDEISVQLQHQTRNEKRYLLSASTTGLVNRYRIYAGAERINNGLHEAGLCENELTVDGHFGYARGEISDALLYGMTIVSGLAVWVISMFLPRFKNRQLLFIRLAAYFSRLCLLGMAYILLRHAPTWIDFLNDRLAYQSSWLAFFSEHLSGDAYRFFFLYFADVYFFAYISFGLIYFLRSSNLHDLETDKYYSLLASLFSTFKLILLKRPLWNQGSKLGLLTVMVKFFFLPYMISWGIQNILHINQLMESHVFNFDRLNDLMQTVFMLADTGIFAFGYLIESRRLGSEIKSVDPFFTGWLFCLWCYPPFNSFSFRYFDYPILPIYISTTPFFQTVMSAVVTALWGVFCIASINLGFKASNLTNRGIVKHGLYRYVRHPAYVCKILAWIIQGVFLGQFTSGIILAFTVVYGLRALTEERHLNLDPDYILYKQKVPWRFIPRVW